MRGEERLDLATAGFLDHFRKGLSGVRNLSGEFDHRKKALKASGGYSFVYSTYWTPQDAPPMQVCYKELHPPPGNAPDHVDLTGKTIKHLVREVRIWRNLDHPTITKFLGYAIEGEGSDMRAVLVSRWCANGDIIEYLRKHPGSNRIQLIKDMANGLQYLHNQTPVVIHGDLKPHNVLISDEGTAQLCDFGLSRVFSELSRGSQTTSATPGFTTRYSAYEVIVEEIKTMKSDIYAFGCTCVFVLFDQHPFPRIKNDCQLFISISNRESPWPWDGSILLERILSACCLPSQELRPSIDGILRELYHVELLEFDRERGAKRRRGRELEIECEIQHEGEREAEQERVRMLEKEQALAREQEFEREGQEAQRDEEEAQCLLGEQERELEPVKATQAEAVDQASIAATIATASQMPSTVDSNQQENTVMSPEEEDGGLSEDEEDPTSTTGPPSYASHRTQPSPPGERPRQSSRNSSRHNSDASYPKSYVLHKGPHSHPLGPIWVEEKHIEVVVSGGKRRWSMRRDADGNVQELIQEPGENVVKYMINGLTQKYLPASNGTRFPEEEPRDSRRQERLRETVRPKDNFDREQRREPSRRPPESRHYSHPGVNYPVAPPPPAVLQPPYEQPLPPRSGFPAYYPPVQPYPPGSQVIIPSSHIPTAPTSANFAQMFSRSRLNALNLETLESLET